MPRDKNARKKYYKKLCERDGECCRICRRVPPNVYLEVDHIDGDKNNNPVDMSNFQLLCESCNRMKNPRGKGKKKQSKKIISRTGSVSDKEMGPELKLSKQYLVSFRQWLYTTMRQRGRMTAKEVIFEGAEHCNCAPYTIRTAYLPMVTSRAGLYRQYPDDSAGEDMVVFRDAKALGINASAIDFIDEELPSQEVI